MPKSKCIECEKTTQHENLFFDCYICGNCEAADSKYEKISLSEAKRKYLLTVEDIKTAELEGIQHYARVGSGLYFLLSQVKQLAYTLAGNQELFEIKKRNREIQLFDRSEHIEQNQITKRATRKRKLTEYLQKRGLELPSVWFDYNYVTEQNEVRSDTKVCYHYIEKYKGKLREIVTVVKKVHVLYEHTPYKTFLENSAREVQQKERQNDRYIGNFTFTLASNENKLYQEGKALEWLHEKKHLNINSNLPKCSCGEFKFDINN